MNTHVFPVYWIFCNVIDNFYNQLARELQDNPEFLEQYVYLLRELGRFEEAKRAAASYLRLVPDDASMQELYESL